MPAPSVSTDVIEVVTGLNDPVAPDGRPETLRSTPPLKPFCGVTVIVVVVLPPCVADTEAGFADNAKSGGPVTVSVTVVVCVSDPLVPVTVNEYVPDVAVPALIVSVEVDVVLTGENEALAPTGTPLMLRFTRPANAPVGVTVIVVVRPAPCARVNADGDADSEKSSPPQGDSLNDAMRVRQLNVPFAGMYWFV